MILLDINILVWDRTNWQTDWKLKVIQILFASSSRQDKYITVIDIFIYSTQLCSWMKSPLPLFLRAVTNNWISSGKKQLKCFFTLWFGFTKRTCRLALFNFYKYKDKYSWKKIRNFWILARVLILDCKHLYREGSEGWLCDIIIQTVLKFYSMRLEFFYY